jgi:hypothetical protein
MANNASEPQIIADRVTSEVSVVDARALLTPEVLAIIREEVRQQIILWEQERQSIDQDTMINTRASHIG